MHLQFLSTPNARSMCMCAPDISKEAATRQKTAPRLSLGSRERTKSFCYTRAIHGFLVTTLMRPSVTRALKYSSFLSLTALCISAIRALIELHKTW